MFRTKPRSLVPGVASALLLFGAVAAGGFSTSAAQRQDSTASQSFVELVPTPAQTVTTKSSATVTALFVAECRVDSPGERLVVRIKIDDRVATPGAVVLTSETGYGSHSVLGFAAQVPAGEHKVTVEWRVSGGRGFVRNRSLTVWEAK